MSTREQFDDPPSIGVGGSYCDGGPCPAGSYCPTGTAEPVRCEEGSFANGTGFGDCSRCPAGHLPHTAGIVTSMDVSVAYFPGSHKLAIQLAWPA